MNTTAYRECSLRRFGATGGFTLAEMMMASAIAALVLGGIMTTYVFSLKGFRSVSNYTEIHASGRKAIDVFARDIRAVSSISSFSASNLVVVIPTNFTSSGSVNGSKTVTYTCSGGALKRTDSSTGITSSLATNINQLTFSLFDRLGSNTTVLSIAKGIQVDVTLRKTVMNQIQSEDYLSARMDMRNIPP